MALHRRSRQQLDNELRREAVLDLATTAIKAYPDIKKLNLSNEEIAEIATGLGRACSKVRLYVPEITSQAEDLQNSVVGPSAGDALGAFEDAARKALGIKAKSGAAAK